jgi:hypothetical protein
MWLIGVLAKAGSMCSLKERHVASACSWVIDSFLASNHCRATLSKVSSVSAAFAASSSALCCFGSVSNAMSDLASWASLRASAREISGYEPKLRFCLFLVIGLT